MRSRSFIELSSCAKICSRICFCLSSPLTISSNEASGFAFSSCVRMAPVCASIVSVASQQGQIIANLEVSAIVVLLAAGSIATKRHKKHKGKSAGSFLFNQLVCSRFFCRDQLRRSLGNAWEFIRDRIGGKRLLVWRSSNIRRLSDRIEQSRCRDTRTTEYQERRQETKPLPDIEIFINNDHRNADTENDHAQHYPVEHGPDRGLFPGGLIVPSLYFDG